MSLHIQNLLVFLIGTDFLNCKINICRYEKEEKKKFSSSSLSPQSQLPITSFSYVRSYAIWKKLDVGKLALMKM